MHIKAKQNNEYKCSIRKPGCTNTESYTQHSFS